MTTGRGPRTRRPTPGDPSQIARPLARWYRARKRDLPWRRDRDPYRIWISEIMLQQTQVKTVVPYYERFLDRFPDPEALAAASEDEVLEYWAGLGYYSRGRNLHRAADQIVREHGGAFPTTGDQLRALPGVGEYTAAAIGSIAFDDPVPVIDGNVERVLARYLALEADPRRADGRRTIHDAARVALDPRAPGDHNQAMMELGATVCVPRSPACPECPIAAGCRARELGRPDEFPPPKVRRRPETQFWVAALPRRGDAWVLTRGAELPFLRGQWGFPLIQVAEEPTVDAAVDAAHRLLGPDATVRPKPRCGPWVEHSITYRRLRIRPVVVGHRPVAPADSDDRRLVAIDDRPRLARLFEKLIEATGN